jgi:hypothetical protein
MGLPANFRGRYGGNARSAIPVDSAGKLAAKCLSYNTFRRFSSPEAIRKNLFAAFLRPKRLKVVFHRQRRGALVTRPAGRSKSLKNLRTCGLYSHLTDESYVFIVRFQAMGMGFRLRHQRIHAKYGFGRRLSSKRRSTRRGSPDKYRPALGR